MTNRKWEKERWRVSGVWSHKWSKWFLGRGGITSVFDHKESRI